EDRAALYEKAVSLLLAHWENRRLREQQQGDTTGEEEVLALGLKVSVLRPVLGKVAFEAHQRQAEGDGRDEAMANIRREDLWEALVEVLPRTAAGDKDYNSASVVTDYMAQRAGLLQARELTTYTFPHRTFQEYLAAVHIWSASSSPVEQLGDLVQQDPAWWREVFLLGASLARHVPFNLHMLIDYILPAELGRLCTETEVELVLLSTQAIHEANFRQHTEIDNPEARDRFTKLYRRVLYWLQTLMATPEIDATKRVTAGNWLDRLGDPRPGVGIRLINGALLPNIELCYVPPGPFQMGSPDSDPHAADREKPLHPVDLDYGYWIGQYPVTVAQYRLFCQITGRETSVGQQRAFQAGENQPMIYVNWWDAMAFCDWLTDTGREQGWLPFGWYVSLPSEAEWEKAARGGMQLPTTNNTQSLPPRELSRSIDGWRPNEAEIRRYPWGDEAQPGMANYADTGIGTTSPVGAFPADYSPYGVMDMAGNLSEWTRSLWKAYPYPVETILVDSNSRETRVFRGGAFGDSLAEWSRCAFRGSHLPFIDFSLGFRIVVSPLSSGSWSPWPLVSNLGP
ncbi:MAG: SUMF1/EgtB/PvdO family nonheme iron enzyme, partial [Anaerolineales bacterium]|nr:SUMF1/EgtB/PvdO family nonheme iron enzyme [Anaerolineales bacterium]